MHYVTYLEINGEQYPCNPIVSDLMLKYKTESGEMFLRAAIEESLVFVREDYTRIMSERFSQVIYFVIMGDSEVWRGKFTRTDCEVNLDDKSVKVKAEVVDNYSAVLGGMDKEFDLIKMKLPTRSVSIDKRPLIQMYGYGTDSVSCHLGGLSWEQSAVATTSVGALMNTYHFFMSAALFDIEFDGIRAGGRISPVNGYWQAFEGTLYTESSYRIVAKVFAEGSTERLGYRISVYDGDTLMYDGYTDATAELPTYFTLRLINQQGGADVDCSMFAMLVFSRYILDVDVIQGEATYEIPADDIVGNNRAYKRCIGYNINTTFYSDALSDEPTEWGQNADGKYYEKPPVILGNVREYTPMFRSMWQYGSFWFSYSQLDERIERDGRKSYVMNDAYFVTDVISYLLKEIGQPMNVVSEFLNDENPIINKLIRLMITPKSNILAGEYTSPAQMAPITLGSVLSMLKNAFGLYWEIEDGNFIIEHISWFENGGTYNGVPVIEDFTIYKDPRNGKPMLFGQNVYEFEKSEMPERYEYSWMDDTTDVFKGDPIIIRDKSVEDKVEDVTIGEFTSDVDFMLLNPSACSEDGFALMVCEPRDALVYNSSGVFYNDAMSGTNGYTTKFPLKEGSSGYARIKYKAVRVGTSTETFNLLFWRDDELISTMVSAFIADGKVREVSTNIPEGATHIGSVIISGTLRVFVYSASVSGYQLGYTFEEINNTTFRYQNGMASMRFLQPKFLINDMPSWDINVNGEDMIAKGISRNKIQKIKFPHIIEPTRKKLIKTAVGDGKIEDYTLSLSSNQTEITLRHITRYVSE